jgi:hypothetical protein
VGDIEAGKAGHALDKLVERCAGPVYRKLHSLTKARLSLAVKWH